MQKSLIIMAGGRGSRYGGLKQFDSFGPKGEFLFEYSIYDAFQYGFGHIVVVTKKELVEEINNYFSLRLSSQTKLDVIAQELSDLPAHSSDISSRTKPWGTAHAVWVCRDVVSDNFLVLNADDFYGAEAFKKASGFMDQNKHKRTFGLIPYNLVDTLSDHGTVARGVCKFENEKLKHIVEFTSIKRENKLIKDQETDVTFKGDEPVSMNMWICSPIIFEEITLALEEFLKDEKKIESDEVYIPKLVQKLIATERIEVLATQPCADWFGVTYAEDKKEAVLKLEDLTSSKKYPSPLWKY